MGKTSKKVKISGGGNYNHWTNQKYALERLTQQYPNTPEPVLLKAWCLWNQTRKMSEKDRKEVTKKLDSMPERPGLNDFDDVELEIKCIEMIEPSVIEVEEIKEDENKGVTLLGED